jgi:CheY-like chemotaxis protein
MATVLVVDDTAVDRKLAGGLLERTEAIEVSYAEDGKDALEKISANVPDLVVTDLQMPEMDGLELVTAISEQYPQIPVLLMTAVGSENVAAQALANGAASFVPKSDLAASLADTVMHILEISDSDSRYKKLIDCTTKTDFEFELPNDPSIVDPLIEMVQQIAVSHGFVPQNSRVQMAVALEHAMHNAMLHGNLEISAEDLLVEDEATISAKASQSPYCDRKVYFRSLVTKDTAEFTVRDEGPGFDTSSVREADDPEGFKQGAGRGLLLIKSFMDKVEFNPTGNEIKMVKFRGGKGR